jgi:hypothetical protein
MGKPAAWSGRSPSAPAAAVVRLGQDGVSVVGFLGLAGLQGDGVRGERAHPQGGGGPGHQVLARDAPAE